VCVTWRQDVVSSNGVRTLWCVWHGVRTLWCVWHGVKTSSCVWYGVKTLWCVWHGVKTGKVSTPPVSYLQSHML